MPVLDLSYEKTQICPLECGFDKRPDYIGLVGIDSLVIHTTNGAVGSSFEGEALFLQQSGMVRSGSGLLLPAPGTGVSAHFLNGKDGRVAMLLDPALRAWHAGDSDYAGRQHWNDFSIGIENHHSIGDTWPDDQVGGLAWLIRRLMRIYPIIKQNIVMHRWIAINPPGRKTDANNWSDSTFRTWVAAL